MFRIYKWNAVLGCLDWQVPSFLFSCGSIYILPDAYWQITTATWKGRTCLTRICYGLDLSNENSLRTTLADLVVYVDENLSWQATKRPADLPALITSWHSQYRHRKGRSINCLRGSIACTPLAVLDLRLSVITQQCYVCGFCLSAVSVFYRSG